MLTLLWSGGPLLTEASLEESVARVVGKKCNKSTDFLE